MNMLAFPSLLSMDFHSPPLQAVGEVLTVIFMVFCLWRLGRICFKNKGVKAPEPRGAWPIVGHLHLLGGQVPAFRTLGAMADKYGPVFTIRLGMHQAVVVSSREAVKECFTTNDQVLLNRPRSAVSKYMGYNNALFGFSPYGPYWLEMRKMTTLEILSNRRLELLKQVRASEVNACINDLFLLCTRNGVPNWSKVDMSQCFRRVTSNILTQMIAGKRCFSVSISSTESDQESSRFVRAISSFMNLAGAFVLSDVIPFIEWMDLQGHIRSMKQTAEELDYFMSNWLEEHLQSMQSGKMKEEHDFIDFMLSQIEDKTSVHGHKRDHIIKATALTLILAGSDSTSITLTWALSLLLNHTEVLKKAQEELDIYVGRERWVEETDIKQLSHLQAIVKETLRIYPAGPLSGPREAMEDCYVGNYYVPKGTHLIVNIWKLHHDPLLWPNPGEFQPERFLNGDGEIDGKGHQFKYMPFTAGRRSCLGMNLGLQTVCFTLARLLQGFNLITEMNAQVDMSEGQGLSLSKSIPLEVMLIPRLSYTLYQR